MRGEGGCEEEKRKKKMEGGGGRRKGKGRNGIDAFLTVARTSILHFFTRLSLFVDTYAQEIEYFMFQYILP